jgi:hypothetical protein
VFCRNCGGELFGSEPVCPYCGALTASSTGAEKMGVVGGTWMPLTAGILAIIAGATGVIFGIVVATLGILAGGLVAVIGVPAIGGIVAGAAAIPLAVGITAIIGGVCALRRRIWGLALAGTICSLFPVWFLGIPAIIFVVLGKGEFEKSR